MDNCIFCKIVKGVIPSARVWEDDRHLAFLSIAPVKPGHTLLIPKAHSDYIFDMADEALSGLILAAKPAANLLKEKLKPETGKIGVMIAGLEVAHTHIHLIPMDSEGDLNFANAKPSTPDELKEILEKITSVS